jgi:DNA polymerase III sliding clamp (beta) subunit (PCNA family)
VISGKNNDTGQTTEARLPARGRAKIAFNGSYLEDLLSRSGETLELRITGPQSPGVARNNGTTHVIMPKFVQW